MNPTFERRTVEVVHQQSDLAPKCRSREVIKCPIQLTYGREDCEWRIKQTRHQRNKPIGLDIVPSIHI